MATNISLEEEATTDVARVESYSNAKLIFMDLSPEVRIRIYQFLFHTPEYVNFHTIYEDAKWRLAVLQVCSEFRTECLRVLWSENTVRLVLSSHMEPCHQNRSSTKAVRKISLFELMSVMRISKPGGNGYATEASIRLPLPLPRRRRRHLVPMVFQGVGYEITTKQRMPWWLFKPELVRDLQIGFWLRERAHPASLEIMYKRVQKTLSILTHTWLVNCTHVSYWAPYCQYRMPSDLDEDDICHVLCRMSTLFQKFRINTTVFRIAESAPYDHVKGGTSFAELVGDSAKVGKTGNIAKSKERAEKSWLAIMPSMVCDTLKCRYRPEASFWHLPQHWDFDEPYYDSSDEEDSPSELDEFEDIDSGSE